MSGDPTIYGQKQFQMPERGTPHPTQVTKSSKRAFWTKDGMGTSAPLGFHLSEKQLLNCTIPNFLFRFLMCTSTTESIWVYLQFVWPWLTKDNKFLFLKLVIPSIKMSALLWEGRQLPISWRENKILRSTLRMWLHWSTKRQHSCWWLILPIQWAQFFQESIWSKSWHFLINTKFP